MYDFVWAKVEFSFVKYLAELFAGWLLFETVWPLSTAWVDTSLAVGLSAAWSSFSCFGLCGGSPKTEMYKQSLCSSDLVAHTFAVQFDLQQSRTGPSTLGYTTGPVHQISVLGHET